MTRIIKLMKVLVASMIFMSPIAKSNDATMDVVDTAVADGSFNTLATALTSAGLIDTLKGEGPFTVFAPTDDAFAALPEGTLDYLLANPSELVKVLTYHVISGQVVASDLLSAMVGSAKTVNGSLIYFAATSEAVKVGESNVTDADIMATNGVIHVIDTVLIPPTDCTSDLNASTGTLTLPCISISGGSSADMNTYQAELQAIDGAFVPTSASVK